MTERGPRAIKTLSEILDGYDAVFCDVWGVIHNGLSVFRDAERALREARAAGTRVLLITNSPRRSAGVETQLASLGLGRDSYDDIVTSGDVTRELIRQAPGPVFHIGPRRDDEIYEDLPVQRVDEADAEAIVVTGLFDDEAETPEDYAPLLGRLAARGLPMICANPDIVVQRGDRLVFCAGALARDYAALGGPVRLAGKPHRPIYEVAAARIGGVDGKRVLAIGDGLATDIKGANGFGLDALLVLAGIHGAELGDDPAAIGRHLEAQGLSAAYVIAALG
ncbi:TIGR01459 family HAD-type hydrolase [Mangrovibrevibacter kandeliae]|uniref:TIGR01459 family HAD-type hydrolase n=1 Tax=Mangrovibrevibacter kandeliae TaxID=2968473 RepID=UPI002117393F|nr:TIGR01459 family HAD-type hydrolase [Aurantimonas sp. CSK15Z-1]MCQ8782060.1 TIGR01459 family HAD-type hydrolase [Aurantimonas sp. CSK15Z-1]